MRPALADVVGAVRKAPEARVQRDGCEVVLVDLQDCGARFYTYIWSMYDVLVAAAGARSGHGNGAPVKVVVLDRPNPLGGQRIEGPVLAEAFSSGVGKRPLSMRHGMTSDPKTSKSEALDSIWSSKATRPPAGQRLKGRGGRVRSQGQPSPFVTRG